jgi:hypothetical protein
MNAPKARPSQRRNTERRTTATVVLRPHDTESSYDNYYSYHPIYSSHKQLDPLGEITKEVEVPTADSRRNANRKRFLKGPISLPELAAAARLPGKALAVYILIRHRCDLQGSSTVTLPSSLLRDFGISRDSKFRALKALEQRGIIQVKREVGLGARITLIAQQSKKS